MQVLNETLVEKIFSQFKDINVNDIYDGKIDDELLNIFDHYKILVHQFRDDPKLNEVRGSYRKTSKNSDYKYVVSLFLPMRDLTERDGRLVINTLFHEFIHIVILRGIEALSKSDNGKTSISDRFNLGSVPSDFKIDNITSDKAIKYLNYVFDITERPVFAFSIAYSCHFYRQEQNAQTLFDLNKKIIIDYENGKLTKQLRNYYVSRLQDEKIFLFLIQYAVYFLSDHKWIIKLDSFMNLIKKYEKRFDEMSENGVKNEL